MWWIGGDWEEERSVLGARHSSEPGSRTLTLLSGVRRGIEEGREGERDREKVEWRVREKEDSGGSEMGME